MFSLFLSQSIALNKLVGLFLRNAHLFTGYVNDFDAPVLYTCPNGGYLNGVYSVHDNKKEDRRYRFRCCTGTPKPSKYFPKHCISSSSKNSI